MCATMHANPAMQRWTIDWDEFEAALTPDVKIFGFAILIIQQAWFLAKKISHIAEVCERKNIAVVSDEIWDDIILDENIQHIPFASLDHPATKRAITFYRCIKNMEYRRTWLC